MYLYIHEGYTAGPDRQAHTESLVKKAAELFLEEKNIPAAGVSRTIYREENGKPVFTELPLQFSVSHTADLWVCIISDGPQPVGVDIQIIKKARRDRIMDWYFTADEKEYAKMSGEEAFFQIWARKEAYAKLTGRGLTRKLAEISTINNDDLHFIDFEVRPGIKGSCCLKEKGDLCLRMI